MLGYDPAVRRVLFVAHGLDNNPRKGGSALMEALRQLGPRPGVELLLAGVGGESWEQAGLPIPIRRAGYISDDKLMAAVYSAADMIVVPSVVENLPNTLLEAMACGLPAVAIEAGGMADAVRDGETGYLVAQGDIVSLAMRLGTLLDDEAARRRMGQAGRQLIAREFSRVIQAERFASLYEQILDSRRSAAQ